MKEEIDRIAGRMAHRAEDALDFRSGIQREWDRAGDGTARRDALEDRLKRLERAASDYLKAEKIVRAFLELLDAARYALDNGTFNNRNKLRSAIRAGEAAFE